MKRLTRMIVLLFICALLNTASPALAEKPQRGVTVMPQVAAGSVSIAGDYWALIIGIDQYRHAPKLESAVKDATGVRDVLLARYGFSRPHVIELLDQQATGPNIQDALYRLTQDAGPEDNVFIYYAGHGQYDKEGRLGWWVPVEGQPRSPGTFITNAAIRDYIDGMKAKHVYLVADSCFSGTLFGKARAMPPLNDKFFANLYANKSRWGLTSGGTEPVADSGKGGHSIFAYHLIKLLTENSEPYLVPSHIFDQIAPVIANNADQTPRSEPLKNTGDEGGQFVFRLVSVSGGPLPPARPKGSEPTVPSGPSAALSQKQQELAALEEETKRAEDEAKQAELDRQIEAKKQQLAEKKKQLQVASLPTPSLPRQTGREITGKDGAPMLLVPEGEFLYGGNNQRLSLSAFYMDKYEVSTAQYAKYMAAAGAKAPYYWPTSVLVSNGQKPVVGVDWHEADAYCRYYGKRLPTEQEWEKAARGTDGRKYPWGNEEPTSRHANFGKSGFNDYGVLVNVGSLEEGKSPYGIYDLAGNAWEWTSS
ncbi:MAG: SUMF1/EgtB/PvdO family nonheme iron enzyme, partial [Nitrospirae bacterium]|nr:SUMF1/EgtB/PvdO family nonheme iron enzyme [Nitrospirota bacterium]